MVMLSRFSNIKVILGNHLNVVQLAVGKQTRNCLLEIIFTHFLCLIEGNFLCYKLKTASLKTVLLMFILYINDLTFFYIKYWVRFLVMCLNWSADLMYEYSIDLHCLTLYTLHTMFLVNIQL